MPVTIDYNAINALCRDAFCSENFGEATKNFFGTGHHKTELEGASFERLPKWTKPTNKAFSAHPVQLRLRCHEVSTKTVLTFDTQKNYNKYRE